MIERYTLPEMAAIWSPQNKFRIWLDIEVAACEALAKRKEIPQSAVNTIKKKAGFNIKRIDAIEKEVKHDVIAFLTSVAEHVGDAARYMHLGMTSSDVLDTALAVQLQGAADLILDQLKKFRAVLKKQAKRYKNTPTVGRSHGIHAEPTSFGLKLANWYEEIGRNIERMQNARKNISVGQISGAVGVFASIDPAVEAYVCKKLKLKPAPVSSQIIQRDRHAEYFTTLAIVAGTLDKFAVEIRHLQRTEVLEAEEFFSKGQKGSSAMPHKRNPVVSEQMAGTRERFCWATRSARTGAGSGIGRPARRWIRTASGSTWGKWKRNTRKSITSSAADPHPHSPPRTQRARRICVLNYPWRFATYNSLQTTLVGCIIPHSMDSVRPLAAPAQAVLTPFWIISFLSIPSTSWQTSIPL